MEPSRAAQSQVPDPGAAPIGTPPADPWRAVLRELGGEGPEPGPSRGWSIAPRRALVAIVAVLALAALAWTWLGRPQPDMADSPAAVAPSTAPPSAIAPAPELVQQGTALATDPIEAPNPVSAPEPVFAPNPVSAPNSVSAPEPDSALASAPASAAVGQTVVVHVAGQVRSPGLVRLAPGARVADAISAAGGVTRPRAMDFVNLARPVVDGEQIFVGPGTSQAAPAGPVESLGNRLTPVDQVAQVVDLNTATVEALDGLPGIGPVLAGRIVQWRTNNGRFTSVEELGEVSGIGDAVLARLRPLVRV